MNKTAKIVIGIVAVLLIVWFVSSSVHKQPTGPIKIGISTMLSGNWAVLGDNIIKAAKLAVADINSSGGINGRQIELITQDSGLDSKTGLSAAQTLINADGIRYVIGGTSSNGTMAAAPIANAAHAIYMTPVTGGSNVDGAGEYIFRTANSDLLAGRDLARAAIKLGFKKIATVTEMTEYTLDIQKTFEDTLASMSHSVVVSEKFQPNTTDFRTIVAKVKNTKPDAILILSQTGVGGATFMKQAKEAGVKVAYLSDFTFVANEDAKKIAGNFEGVYFADPSFGNGDISRAFFERFAKEYGSPSVIPFHAASTYDSMMMLSQALKVVGDDSSKVHDWLLSNIRNWKGIMGVYSLDKNGNSDLGFTIKVVKNGKYVSVD